MVNTIMITRDVDVENESPWNVIEDVIINLLRKYGKLSEEESLLVLGFDVYEKFYSECVNVMLGKLPESVKFLFFRNIPIIKSYHPKFIGKIIFYATVV